jgi:hypothetical protein
LETIPATSGEKPVDSAQPLDFRDKAKAQSVLGRLTAKPAAATPLASAAKKKRVHIADLQDLGSLPSAGERPLVLLVL